MEMNTTQLYRTLVRVILFAAATIIALWFLWQVYSAILLLLVSLVLTVVINKPVGNLEQKGWKRGWAALAIFLAILIVLGVLAWIVIPKVSQQFQVLLANLPQYVDTVQNRLNDWLDVIPGMGKQAESRSSPLTEGLPSVSQALMRIGNISLSVLNVVLIVIIVLSMVVYAVVNPKPLATLYFSFFHPQQREAATKAFREAAVMLSGWFRSNMIGGFIEAVATVIVLSLLGVPGAWVWGALALFAELIPRLGFYIMAVPPTLVALSISNATAIWVAVFFIVMDEVMADFVMPQLRSNTMNIHPVPILFMVLAMGSAFGFVGILLATPLTAIIKAYYENFYEYRLPVDKELPTRIAAIIYAKDKHEGD
ncbi:Predicted PurR-regulated permease PerM [Cnuella takakiae]|uniref:Predicted PurR-regulated permease PerM n=1 Tax=Cnuella takakiae TaxID=1302690 RepID=A0A1M4SQH5_9BACT|nr:AI-2E family transporter [Cnuella takakiae]OLY95574.1 hypothetical protein BUE76_00515 [Cnuella takakiae]SHE34448.1 Predicted PurR-regulated permease PerM [Cnuella takakiae]